ncbi:MAG TPA: threonine synthase [Desulfobacteraceae bacterium]|nr:threonine synthase [Desulfobacteraceae bacterium]HPQ29808.1 threonine synthase [Desulfobacteraceae bacterium]
MKLDQFPEDIRTYLLPDPKGQMIYRCLSCHAEYDIDRLLYTCPECGSVLLLHDINTKHIKDIDAGRLRRIFDYRKMLNHKSLKGIFRFYEFIAPIIPLDRIVYLGEGNTPLIEANERLKTIAGIQFYFKNDGLNPSASFKDRGMACALSYINYLAKKKNMTSLLAICASTGDTSASAALYASYLEDFLKSAVLLPEGKVTPQQLSQPLGSGARVIEIPGVFDDTMKVVESLADNYHVALLNSKNSWRILGQESFAFEIAQDFDYEVGDKVIFVPIGNAGNITAVMSGFLKFRKAGIIDHLPKIIGVQSEHADPVYKYYLEDEPEKRRFVPVTVKPSVAQAAMIGNPVSMPRVIQLVQEYNIAAGGKRVFVVQVREQEIMDSMLLANRNGNIACTQGGESFAGLLRAVNEGLIESSEIGILDSTAHALKFSVFQDMYFNDTFDPEFNIIPKSELRNAPVRVRPASISKYPEQGKPLPEREMKVFVEKMTEEIAGMLGLERIKKSS